MEQLFDITGVEVIGEYLSLARYTGVSIEHILETHNHADHVSGHGRLAAATGAAIHV
ncbi:MAG: MBL fold metallo-hydrolase, partial [Actinobacteria bacterium]|nr:MBL fold metallo-hydrolase [Actinomycetota bacterium]